jgi:hypothetical protein
MIKKRLDAVLFRICLPEEELMRLYESYTSRTRQSIESFMK